LQPRDRRALAHLVAHLDQHLGHTPACDDGISIDALSLSTVIRLCSTLHVSPGLTKTSITATSSKSPMSGTTTSIGPLRLQPAQLRPGAGAAALQRRGGRAADGGAGQPGAAAGGLPAPAPACLR
jgi:hypothetical protein